MISLSARKAAFRRRCSYAAAAIMRREDSREFDNCFEMYDGEFVVVALMRRAKLDVPLKEAICHTFRVHWEDLAWQATVLPWSPLSDRAIEDQAAHAQIEGEWEAREIMFPLFEAAPEIPRFRVTRRLDGVPAAVDIVAASSPAEVQSRIDIWSRSRTIRGEPYASLFACIEIKRM